MKKLFSKLIPDWETAVGVGICVLIVALILSAIFKTLKILCFFLIIAAGIVTFRIGCKAVAKFMDEEIMSGLGWSIVTFGMAVGTILLWPTWMG